MSFRSGQYDFLVWPACEEKFETIVPDLQRQGTSREAFIRALRKIRAEVQLGRQSPDLYQTGADIEYAVNLFGFQVHIEIDQLLMAFTIVDIEDKPV